MGTSGISRKEGISEKVGGWSRKGGGGLGMNPLTNYGNEISKTQDFYRLGSGFVKHVFDL